MGLCPAQKLCARPHYFKILVIPNRYFSNIAAPQLAFSRVYAQKAYVVFQFLGLLCCARPILKIGSGPKVEGADKQPRGFHLGLSHDSSRFGKLCLLPVCCAQKTHQNRS